jgi:hypothetical protein
MWYVAIKRGGEVHWEGPLGMDALRQMAHVGSLKPNSQLWQPGSTQPPVPASQVLRFKSPPFAKRPVWVLASVVGLLLFSSVLMSRRPASEPLPQPTVPPMPGASTSAPVNKSSRVGIRTVLDRVEASLNVDWFADVQVDGDILTILVTREFQAQPKHIRIGTLREIADHSGSKVISLLERSGRKVGGTSLTSGLWVEDF